MMTSRNVPLRGTADSTKRESAPPANPQSLNRYAYVLNNPTSLTDPLGLQAGDDCSGDNWIWNAECQGPPVCSWVGDPDCCQGGPGDDELCASMDGIFPPPIQWNPLPPIIPPTAAGQLGALGYVSPGDVAVWEQQYPVIDETVWACVFLPVCQEAALTVGGAVVVGAAVGYGVAALQNHLASKTKFPTVDEVKRDCTLLRTVTEPAKKYPGGTSVEEEYLCDGVPYTIHCLYTKTGMQKECHVRPGYAKGWGLP